MGHLPCVNKQNINIFVMLFLCHFPFSFKMLIIYFYGTMGHTLRLHVYILCIYYLFLEDESVDLGLVDIFYLPYSRQPEV